MIPRVRNNGAKESGLVNLYRAELLDADDEALCCSGLRPGPSLSSPQSSMSTSLRERGTDSVPEATPRRRPSPWAFNDSLRARRTEIVGLQERAWRKQNWFSKMLQVSNTFNEMPEAVTSEYI